MWIRLFLLIAIVVFTGCASNPMAVSPQQEVKHPLESQSQVFFMRSSIFGSAISGSLYDVTGGDIKFIGVIMNGTKLAYQTTPGKHVFMVVSEAADFMEGELVSGKNYFSIVTPRTGVWKARFSLWPIKNDPSAEYHTAMPDFTSWLNSTKLVENTETSISWYESNKDSVKQKYDDYWPVWQNKSASDISKRTLAPEDGM